MYLDTGNIKEKPNRKGWYWVSYNNCLVMAVILNDSEMKLISNRRREKEKDEWKECKDKPGWVELIADIDTLQFFNFSGLN